MARALWPLFLLLVACAPRPAASGPVLLVPGGRIVGAWAELDGGFPLPAPPLLADRRENRLYLAYPYELNVYEDGEPVASVDLPGIPRFLHARPAATAGGEEGLYAEGLGSFPYPAKDARVFEGAVYWLDAAGRPHRDQTSLEDAAFHAVVADQKRLAFLGEEAWVLGGERFPLPAFLKAELFGALYLLQENGVLAYSLGGLLLAERRGRFSDLAVDEHGVWLLAEDGRLVHLDHDLEVLP